ncbi:imidazole glycerol phosphate synthase subunit HisH [Desertivirga brevis]|uniref:imidazole glycerol phosphate synthase subunit HisH n=1 Tax=Desertivirga brevis TaxID=2810310 RepID=UPI001A963B8F|nr:imidazole glycerol phosphate synthase subunit HisH [Pedobacter sp. SYSU D00873]
MSDDIKIDSGNAQVGIVNYGAGNIFSLTAALERQNISYEMINSVDEFERYERIIIPGVGHAGAAMKKLQESGMVEKIKNTKKPVLGICVGMQLLTDHSEEGDAQLLGIAPLKTRHFLENLKLKVPHMGWNKVNGELDNELFKDIPSGTYFYYVHSYFIEFNPTFTIASTEYGLKYSAALKNGNFYGVQFHPEKSGLAGEQLLKNFASIKVH